MSWGSGSGTGSAPVPRRDEGFFESDDAESTSGTTGLRDESVPLRVVTGVAERETGTGNRDDDIKIVNDHVFKNSLSNNNATKSAMSSNVTNTGKNRGLTRFSAPEEYIKPRTELSILRAYQMRPIFQEVILASPVA